MKKYVLILGLFMSLSLISAVSVYPIQDGNYVGCYSGYGMMGNYFGSNLYGFSTLGLILNTLMYVGIIILIVLGIIWLVKNIKK